jgi:colanic acid/amylovoran biosynthesis glycosyltransferase
MRLGMLLPEFPTQTHAFFWREIEALRAMGVEVHILSTRPPAAACPHAFATLARAQTHYLFPPALRAVLSNARHAPASWGPALRYMRRLSQPVGNTAKILGYVLCAADLLDYSRRHRLDHIHVHSCANAAHLGAMARLMGGPTYSLHLHGDLPVYGTDHALKSQGASFVAAAARPMQRQLIDEVHLSEARTRTLWMGVDTEQYTRRSHTEAASVHFVTVGRLALCKGHRFGFAALRRAVDQGLDARMSVGGSGADEPEIRRSIQEHGLEDRVTMLGSLGESEVRALLSTADAFVLSSVGLGEASPVAVMEAMASGIPIVCSLIGGTADMLNDGEEGFLVPQEDIDGLTRAFMALSDPQRRARMGAAARTRAVAQFDCRHTSLRLLDAIRETTAAGRPARDRQEQPV